MCVLFRLSPEEPLSSSVPPTPTAPSPHRKSDPPDVSSGRGGPSDATRRPAPTCPTSYLLTAHTPPAPSPAPHSPPASAPSLPSGNPRRAPRTLSEWPPEPPQSPPAESH